MFCKKCGARNNDIAGFCRKCGAPLHSQVSRVRDTETDNPSQTADKSTNAGFEVESTLASENLKIPFQRSESSKNNEGQPNSFRVTDYTTRKNRPRKDNIPDEPPPRFHGFLNAIVVILYLTGSALWFLASINILVAIENRYKLDDSSNMAIAGISEQISKSVMDSLDNRTKWRTSFPELVGPATEPMIFAIIAFILSLPFIRFLAWVLMRISGGDRRLKQFNISLVVFGSILIAAFLVWQFYELGTSEKGFKGPLDIVLPIVAIFYQLVVWSAIERQLSTEEQEDSKLDMEQQESLLKRERIWKYSALLFFCLVLVLFITTFYYSNNRKISRDSNQNEIVSQMDLLDQNVNEENASIDQTSQIPPRENSENILTPSEESPPENQLIPREQEIHEEQTIIEPPPSPEDFESEPNNSSRDVDGLGIGFRSEGILTINTDDIDYWQLDVQEPIHVKIWCLSEALVGSEVGLCCSLLSNEEKYIDGCQSRSIPLVGVYGDPYCGIDAFLSVGTYYITVTLARLSCSYAILVEECNGDCPNAPEGRIVESNQATGTVVVPRDWISEWEDTE
jgi:hypothetical protein